MVEGQKMSKSLGNFHTLRDLLAKGWTGREIRYALLTVNYRLPLNFTMAGLEGARAALARIDEWAIRLEEKTAGIAEPSPLTEHADRFFAALDDDLNISGAMGHLFDLIRESNRAFDAGELTSGHATTLRETWRCLNAVLVFDREAAAVPAAVLALLEQRQQARTAKNWSESDRLRDEIAALGWVVKDTKDGPKLTPR
jgi:cysteinyl-tRNA synthetase